METERSPDSSEQTLTTRCGKQQTTAVSTKTHFFLTSESFSAVEYAD